MLFIFYCFFGIACGSADRKDGVEEKNVIKEELTNTNNEIPQKNLEKQEEKELDVIYMNSIPDYTQDIGEDLYTRQKNIFCNCYDSEDNEEALYAFVLELNNYWLDGEDFPIDRKSGEDYYEYEARQEECLYNEAINLLEELNFTILYDYPYTKLANYNIKEEKNHEKVILYNGICAFAGKLEDVKKIFDNTERINGWVCFVYATSRPDIYDKLMEVGKDEFDDNVYIWYARNADVIESVLGSENQVTIKTRVK